MCVCTPLVLTVSPDCVNLQNISDPWSGYGCCGGAWGEKNSHKISFGQIRNYLIISRHTAISKSRRTIIFKVTRTKEVKMRRHLQDNEGREVGEGIVWNVCDLVEGQRHGLQGRQGV